MLFELVLLISHAFLFQVFNATDNSKATRATHSFLDLKENFTELKYGDESLFLRKYFATNFIFDGSSWMNRAW